MPNVQAVAFDLNGTLLDPAALAEPWNGGAPEGFGRRALADALGLAWVDTLHGGFRPLPDLLQGALARQAELAGLDPAKVPEAMERAKALPPFADAAPALQHVRDAGLRVVVVTNSAAVAARSALDAADLLFLVDEVAGVDAVRAYKPSPKAYTIGPEPETSWFVAAHWWDVTGARRAGYRTAWVERGDGPLMPTVPEPDVRAATVLEAVREIV
ncbi:HAD-IA family hydrolase [Conexibacter sp. SYSU D00693]|uniref:HAD-IA family hydrolase n=1 Tax=Conexibacter sp. SYSU D00693 TaxID=2812560 RepID=UPI00196AFDC5|nr:HAD-IA family hydrolase [Conexibacter sp. SYSU D00693]